MACLKVIFTWCPLIVALYQTKSIEYKVSFNDSFVNNNIAAIVLKTKIVCFNMLQHK